MRTDQLRLARGEGGGSAGGRELGGERKASGL